MKKISFYVAFLFSWTLGFVTPKRTLPETDLCHSLIFVHTDARVLPYLTINNWVLGANDTKLDIKN